MSTTLDINARSVEETLCLDPGIDNAAEAVRYWAHFLKNCDRIEIRSVRIVEEK